MKILKRIIFLLLLIIGFFLLLGILKPSVEYGHEIVVNKPVSEAWAVSKDIDKYHEWLEGFKSMELLSGEQGEIGSTYKIIVNPGEGQPDFEMVETIRDIKENEYVDLNFKSDMMDFDQKIIFSEKEGATSIRSESQVSGKGIVMRAMFAAMELFTNSFHKQEAKNFEALKVLIEKNTTNYNPEPIVAPIEMESSQ